MPFALYYPTTAGRAALAELDRVPWSKLEHAYWRVGMDRPGPGAGLHHDVQASLRALGDAEPGFGISALFANVYHQRTVYEAAAYAVPFIAAVAADPDFPSELSRPRLIVLLLAITLASMWTTEDGTQAGALGDGTMELIRAALLASLPVIEAAIALEPWTTQCIPALRDAITHESSKARFDALRPHLHTIEAEVDRRRAIMQAAEADTAPPPTETARFRHAKFGDATLVRRLDNDRLQLRFDDGTERVLVARFVTPI